jgi:hypothetical protein
MSEMTRSGHSREMAGRRIVGSNRTTSTAGWEVMQMRNRVVSESAAELIARTVRDWAHHNGLPPQAPVETAAQLAAAEFGAGAGVLEACGAARKLLRSWANHPSSQRYMAGVDQGGPFAHITHVDNVVGAA